MLNIEKYKDKLIELGVINPKILAKVKGKLNVCESIFCIDCDYSGVPECNDEVKDWLFSEYEEPEVDWSKVKVDTPILVKDILKSEWIKRYFAKYENGKVYVWKEGKTSWSAVNEHNVNFWKYAKLAESEE